MSTCSWQVDPEGGEQPLQTSQFSSNRYIHINSHSIYDKYILSTSIYIYILIETRDITTDASFSSSV